MTDFTTHPDDALRLTHRAILTEPRYDLHRLVFCDRLQELGVEPEYEEFTRWQCENPTWEDIPEPLYSRYQRSKAEWFPGPHACVYRGVFSSDAYPGVLLRRGFVAEVRAPLAWLVGGECSWCTDEMVPEMSGGTCRNCNSTGRTPGHLDGLVRTQPVTKVVVTDREPAEWHGAYFWERDGEGVDFHDGGHYLPSCVFDAIPGPAIVTTGHDIKACGPWYRATAAVSYAILNPARTRVGLPPLPEEEYR